MRQDKPKRTRPAALFFGLLLFVHAVQAEAVEPGFAGAAVRFERAVSELGGGQWTFLSEAPVLEPGGHGAWDDFAIAYPWVLRETDDGAIRYRMWYRGCFFRGRQRACAIGHASSNDGIRWRKDAAPVFVPGEADQSRRLHGLAVARAGDTYYLWYSLAPDIFGTQKHSALYLAVSPSGLHWYEMGQVLAATEEAPFGIEPSVLYDGSSFHLWFVDSLQNSAGGEFKAHDGAPFLMHFTSADARHWQESGRFPLHQPGGPLRLERIRVTVETDPDSGYQASFFEKSGARWGRLVSSDGNAWQLHLQPTPIGFLDLGLPLGNIRGATSLRTVQGALVWFEAGERGRMQIRAGFLKD